MVSTGSARESTFFGVLFFLLLLYAIVPSTTLVAGPDPFLSLYRIDLAFAMGGSRI